MNTLLTYRFAHKVLTCLIAIVWLVNGLVCKVLDLVPRHTQLVARILGEDYARELTFLIGLSEIVMTVWILSGIKSRLNAIAQIAIVLLMNVIELIRTPDLLLWGRWNALFAGIFAGLVYYNEYHLNKNPK